jgi:hypothetical protein
MSTSPDYRTQYRWPKFIEGLVEDLRDRDFIPWCIKRRVKFWWQRQTRGFDDSETWSLDNTLAGMIWPRIARLKELNTGYPCDIAYDYGDEEGPKKWNEYLDKMILAFKLIEEDKCFFGEPNWREKEEEQERKIDEGLDLFRKYYRNLWW